MISFHLIINILRFYPRFFFYICLILKQLDGLIFERKMVNESDVTFDECLKVLNGEFDYLEHTAIRDPLAIFGNSKYYQDNEGTNYEEEEYTFLNSQDDLNISKIYGETPEETEDILSHKPIEKKSGEMKCVLVEVEKNIKNAVC